MPLHSSRLRSRVRRLMLEYSLLGATITLKSSSTEDSAYRPFLTIACSTDGRPSTRARQSDQYLGMCRLERCQSHTPNVDCYEYLACAPNSPGYFCLRQRYCSFGNTLDIGNNSTDSACHALAALLKRFWGRGVSGLTKAILCHTFPRLGSGPGGNISNVAVIFNWRNPADRRTSVRGTPPTNSLRWPGDLEDETRVSSWRSRLYRPELHFNVLGRALHAGS